MSGMQKPKIVLALVATILAVVLVIQNTEAVETRILFFTLTLPRALLFALLFSGGVIVGLLAAYWLSSRPSKTE